MDSTQFDANDFIAIAVGIDHGLALKADGSIVGWGSNDWGYNWYGEATPPEGNDFVAIAAGGIHSLALKSDGSIVAWGINDRSLPYDYDQVRDTPDGNDFVAIAAGDNHNLALKCDGSIVAWGINDGSVYDNGQVRDAPNGNNFVAIAGQVNHCLALKSDGSIVGWGDDADYSFGRAMPPEGNDFVAIAAGNRHNLALKSDGSIVGLYWYHSDQNTLFDGNDFVAIAAGSDQSLALKSDGSIIGWGSNYYGQTTPPSGGRASFVAIAAGGYIWSGFRTPAHSLALKSDGSIIAWGISNGDFFYDSGQVRDALAGNDFVAIAAGAEHSLALKSDGSIVGWGANDFGQATPPVGNGFVAITAGGWHSLALKSDGSIVGWGLNNDGQATPPVGNDFVAIAAGGYAINVLEELYGGHSLALKEDGSIVGWGYNNDGQATAPAGNDFIAIAAGSDHSLAIRETPTKYGGGTGEPNDPYHIATAEDLILLGETTEYYDKHFILTADIDLDPNLPGRKVFDGAVIAPDNYSALNENGYQAHDGRTFGGIFDGNSHTISHLMIAGENYLGLFGKLKNGAEVRGLALVDVNITGSGDYVGGLVGNNNGYVSGCYSTGEVSGNTSVGGLVGIHSHSGTVITCYSTVTVNGIGSVGGLVGSNNGTLSNCYSAGMASGEQDVGGLIGNPGDGGVFVPGCCRWMGVSAIVDCFWDVEMTDQTNSAWGVGAGKTTAKMQDIQTYLVAGWDFVGEVENGTSEVWQMPQEGGYPKLTKFSNYTPPQLRGMGTPEDPYLISNALELGAIASYSPSAHYQLVASIDLADIQWSTAVIPHFAGTFDGNGMTITNLTIDGGGYLGLFGRLSSEGKVKNLGVVDVNIKGSFTHIGSLIGYNVGTVSMCYGSGKVSWGIGLVGGLVGENYGMVTSSHSISEIHGAVSIGGLIGGNSGCVIECYSASETDGMDMYVGGLVGRNDGNIATSYSTGTVASIDSASVGGLVGYNDNGSITNCYSNGTVSGDGGGGGLVGRNSGIITTSYSTYIVGAGHSCGGLVGSGSSSGVTLSFWDMEISGRTMSAGGIGLTTAEMQSVTTFQIWGTCGNGGIWNIDDGRDYPRLWWQNLPGEPIAIEETLSDLLIGEGTEDSPYLIYSGDELNLISLFPCDWNKHFKLMANIDLDPNLPNGRVFDKAVIGAIRPGFTGVFDGNGHTISHLTITGKGILGLFGHVSDPNTVIMNLSLIRPSITSAGGSGIGSIVGCLESGRLSSCFAEDCTVTGEMSVGGLVGNNHGDLTDCHCTGEVRGSEDVGGLVGSNGNLGMSGDLSISAIPGGVIRSCYSTNIVKGVYYVGGLVGRNYGTIESCYSLAEVTGESCVGGLVGINGYWYVIDESWMWVSGDYVDGTVYNSYSAGEVVGTSSTGGLVGLHEYGEITNSFWDIQISGQAESGGGTGKTTNEMQTASTFLKAGWDFVDETANGTEDIWWILEGQDYPRLWWETDNN
jgi:alpha-tubulin suppressor-like RCC1 family protein